MNSTLTPLPPSKQPTSLVPFSPSPLEAANDTKRKKQSTDAPARQLSRQRHSKLYYVANVSIGPLNKAQIVYQCSPGICRSAGVSRGAVQPGSIPLRVVVAASGRCCNDRRSPPSFPPPPPSSCQTIPSATRPLPHHLYHSNAPPLLLIIPHSLPLAGVAELTERPEGPCEPNHRVLCGLFPLCPCARRRVSESERQSACTQR